MEELLCAGCGKVIEDGNGIECEYCGAPLCWNCDASNCGCGGYQNEEDALAEMDFEEGD